MYIGFVLTSLSALSMALCERGDDGRRIQINPGAMSCIVSMVPSYVGGDK